MVDVGVNEGISYLPFQLSVPVVLYPLVPPLRNQFISLSGDFSPPPWGVAKQVKLEKFSNSHSHEGLPRKHGWATAAGHSWPVDQTLALANNFTARQRLVQL